MRSEAPSYIDARRPAFECAIADFRTVSGLGVTMESTDRSVMDLGPEAVEAWRKVTGQRGR